MFFDNSEEKIPSLEKRIQELEIQIESLNRNISILFETEGIDPQAIEEKLKDPNQFSKEEWDEILIWKNDHHTKLSEIMNENNKSQTASEKLKALKDSHNWLSVK